MVEHRAVESQDSFFEELAIKEIQWVEAREQYRTKTERPKPYRQM
ncbi:MAG: hypothetical protein VYA34_15540 [Myxococcota bacterium]|nr:hypothetical protein [Myxococcota bacterium]